MKVLIALLFLLLFALPAGANHQLTSAPYACTSWDAVMETVRLQKAGGTSFATELARTDTAFKCYIVPRTIPFRMIELVYEYTVDGLARGVVRIQSSTGKEFWTFGTMEYIDKMMHEQGV